MILDLVEELVSIRVIHHRSHAAHWHLVESLALFELCVALPDFMSLEVHGRLDFLVSVRVLQPAPGQQEMRRLPLAFLPPIQAPL